MALTQQQNIPEKPRASEPWTFRKLFPFIGATAPLFKVFVNPFDVLLGYLIFVAGIAELINRQVSWFFWALIILILIADLFERHINFLQDKKPINKKIKK